MQDYLRQKIVQEEMLMVSDPEDQSRNHLPEDTVSLSYWLSRRLPISDQQKLSLLSIHCPTLRITQALHILQVSLSLSFPVSLSPSLPVCVSLSLPPSLSLSVCVSLKGV